MSLKFASNNERDEWLQLGVKNEKLRELVIDLEETLRLMYGKDVVLTSVFRRQDEQDALYKDEEKKVAKSPHSYWKAVDIRSRHLTQSEIDFVVSYLNTKYKNANGKPVAIYHSLKSGAPHVHIQLLD